MKPNNNLLAPLGVGFAIGAIAIGTVVLLWHHDREPHHYSIPPASGTTATPITPPALDPAQLSRLNSTAPPVVDPAVARVAARFACSCGTCGEERLDICSCATAQAERTFIQEQLRNGRSESEAAEALKQKYGGLKS
jgi:hypothetical protein